MSESGPESGPPTGSEQLRSQRLSLTALVTGLLALLFLLFGIPFFSILLGAIAIITGIMSIIRIRQGRASGKAKAIVGIATGAVGLILAIVFTVLVSHKINDCKREHPGISGKDLDQCVRDKLNVSPRPK